MGSGKGAAVLRGGQAAQVRSTPLLQVEEDLLVPKGLQNVGNTCYANAALQCLLSTALSDVLLDPKAVIIFRRYSSNPNLLAMGSGSVDSQDGEDDTLQTQKLSRREARRKQREDRRMHETSQWLTRELTDITREYTKASSLPRKQQSNNVFVNFFNPGKQWPRRVVDPSNITKHPDRLSRCLRPYQQEDAHEFMRALLSTLVMNGHNKKLSCLFDGLLESAVTCQTCSHASLTRDRYMDLSLDISHTQVSTLEDALKEFNKTEVLEGDNMVHCEKCTVKRTVTKGLRLATAPSILVCHLKRFAYDRFGRLTRLHKHVKFPRQLEIGEYMSRVNKATPPPYELVGVLVHQGKSCDSGHYLAYVKSGDDWFKANDSVVTKVDIDVVMSQQAYILLYEVAEMRVKNGFANVYREPPPNVVQMQSSFLDDASWVPSVDGKGREPPFVAATIIPDGVAASLFSMLCGAAMSAQEVNEAFQRGDLCCSAIHTDPDVATDGVANLDPLFDELDVKDDETTTLGESTVETAETSKRTPICKSTSSSDLKYLENRASKAYQLPQHGHPIRLPHIAPRTQSFSGHSDPGGDERPLMQVSYRRRSMSAKKWKSASPRLGVRDSTLPPLKPNHKRPHSGLLPPANVALSPTPH